MRRRGDFISPMPVGSRRLPPGAPQPQDELKFRHVEI